MRAMFGLVSLLVGVAVLFYLFTKDTSETLRVSKPMQEQARQMSGRGEDGGSAMDSFKVEPQSQGSQLRALLVTDVKPGGAADTFYGLKKGDLIIDISTAAGLQKINDASNGDPEMAKAMLAQESFQASRPIVVMRDGKQLTLPASAAPAPIASTPVAPAPASPASPPPAQPGNASQSPAPPAPQQQPRNIWEQVDGIKKAAGH
jgi:hypothetical protein